MWHSTYNKMTGG